MFNPKIRLDAPRYFIVPRDSFLELKINITLTYNIINPIISDILLIHRVYDT